MATKANIKDVNGLETVLDTKLEAISKDMVEEVLTGEIDSHTHDYSASNHDHDSTYLGKSDTALDSDKLDGKHASDFADVDHDHDTTYLGINAKASDSDKLDGLDSTDFAQLVNGKILEGNLPDYIFGQVLFGGSVAINTFTNKLVCTLSAKFKSKYNITENTLLLENMPAFTYEGVYFMATNSWNTPPNDAQVGDWIISNGSSWSKVDNSDVVSSVNGQIGAVVLTHADVGAASSNHTHNYESLTDIPENISMGEFVLSEVNLKNITETCICPLQYGHKYYSAPDKICGTDEMRDDLEGFLFVYKRDDIVSQQLHDTINNILYIRSFNRISGEWSLWKRLLTCLDTTDVIEQEGEEYVFTIERDTEIYIPSGEKEFDSKNDTIIIDISNILIGGTIHFKVYFSVPITGAININIDTNDSNPRTYSTFYVDPTTIPSSQINSGIEYRVWRYPTYWYIMNRIF